MVGMSSSPYTGRLSAALFAVLVLLGATGPLATDMYLPSFPAMQQEFAATASSVQLTLTTFLVGMALGQLLWGALSDRWGRSTPLRYGTLLFVLASICAAIAPSLELLTVARGVQGVGAAAGLVLSKAIVADVTSGAQTARIFSILMTIGGVAPAVAPLLGAGVAQFGGWRAVLWVLGFAAALMALGSFAVVRETHPVQARSTGALFTPLWRVLRQRRFVGYMVLFASAFASMMAYIAASPFLYQNIMGFSPTGYAIGFGINSLGLIVSGIISARLATKVPLRRTIAVALLIVLGASLVMLALAFSGVQSALLGVVIFFMVAPIGMILGNTTGLALSEVRKTSGSGSAALGCTQFLAGALVSPLVGLGGEDSPVAFAVTALISLLLAVAAFIYTTDSRHTALREA